MEAKHENRQEDRLLVILSRCSITDDELSEARSLLHDDLRWDRFLLNCFVHRVYGMVYGNIGQFYNVDMFYVPIEFIAKDRKWISRTGVPPFAVALLKTLCHGWSLRRNILYPAAEVLFGSLQSAGIRAAGLKGIVLGGHVYSDISLRPFSDIDFIAEADDYEGIHGIMLELGYKQMKSDASRHHFPPYLKKTGKPEQPYVVVEYHHDLFAEYDGFQRSTTDLIDRCSYEDYPGFKILVPSPEDLLIHSCGHIYRHARQIRAIRRMDDQSLLNYCDINEIIRTYRNTLDWGELEKIVLSENLQMPVSYGLSYTSALFGTELPRQLLDRIMPPAFDSKKEAFYDRESGALMGHWMTPLTKRLFDPMRFKEAVSIMQNQCNEWDPKLRLRNEQR